MCSPPIRHQRIHAADGQSGILGVIFQPMSRCLLPCCPAVPLSPPYPGTWGTASALTAFSSPLCLTDTDLPGCSPCCRLGSRAHPEPGKSCRHAWLWPGWWPQLASVRGRVDRLSLHGTLPGSLPAPGVTSSISSREAELAARLLGKAVGAGGAWLRGGHPRAAVGLALGQCDQEQGLCLLQVLQTAPLASACSRISRNVLFPDLFKANSPEVAELSSVWWQPARPCSSTRGGSGRDWGFIGMWGQVGVVGLLGEGRQLCRQSRSMLFPCTPQLRHPALLLRALGLPFIPPNVWAPFLPLPPQLGA